MGKKKQLREIQQQILKERGLHKRKQHKLSRYTLIDDDHLCYTKQMMIAELTIGLPLREYLFSKSDAKLARILSVDKSTISRWRARLRNSEKGGKTYES